VASSPCGGAIDCALSDWSYDWSPADSAPLYLRIATHAGGRDPIGTRIGSACSRLPLRLYSVSGYFYCSLSAIKVGRDGTRMQSGADDTVAGLQEAAVQPKTPDGVTFDGRLRHRDQVWTYT
jgi:hypothetical protein